MAIMLCTEVQYVQPGSVLVSVADMFKSQWVVESTCCVVATRKIELTMVCGTRRVTKATGRDETVLRRVGTA